MALKITPLMNQDLHCNSLPEQNPLANDETLSALWNKLKYNVIDGVLQLNYEMSQIEKESSDQLPSTEKTLGLFKKLRSTLSPLFFEAKMNLDHTIASPLECAQLQEILEKKWEDEALQILWDKALRGQFKDRGTLVGQGPKGPIEIRSWMKNHPSHLKQISYLNLKGLGIKVCPREIAEFSSLSHLVLSNNQLKSFSIDLSQCVDLSLLNIDSNQLTTFSPDLSKCTKLSNLSLFGNRLTDFSINLSNCARLHHLYLGHNQIKNISSDLSKCTELQWITLSNNQLEEFSTDLSRFPFLYSFSCSHNQLKSFQINLSKCTHLRCLDISNNQITTFSPDLINCTSLAYLNYNGKPKMFESDMLPFSHPCDGSD